LGTPLFFVTGRYLEPAAARAGLERQERLADATSLLREHLGAQPVVKAFGLQERAIGDYAARLERLFRAALRLTFVSNLAGLSANSIASGIQLLVLGAGGWLVTGGGLTAGALVAFLALLAQTVGPLQSIPLATRALRQASGALDRVDQLLNAPPAIEDAPGTRALGPLSRGIAFEGVTFGYGDDRPALRELSLAIPAGATVALVGPSGCGKS